MTEKKTDQDSGSFWDHLEVLRRKILLMLGLILGAGVILFLYGDRLLELLLRLPGSYGIRMVYLRPYEKLAAYLQTSFLTALICGLPFVLLELASFILPGLTGGERKIFITATAAVELLYALGISFGYLLLVPYGVGFFASFGSGEVLPYWSISAYISTVLTLVLVSGCVFFLPILLLASVKTGLVELNSLKKGRKYVVVILFLFAALITPPDVFTQILVGGILYLLYEVSILIAGVSLFRSLREDKNGQT